MLGPISKSSYCSFISLSHYTKLARFVTQWMSTLYPNVLNPFSPATPGLWKLKLSSKLSSSCLYSLASFFWDYFHKSPLHRTMRALKVCRKSKLKDIFILVYKKKSEIQACFFMYCILQGKDSSNLLFLDLLLRNLTWSLMKSTKRMSLPSIIDVHIGSHDKSSGYKYTWTSSHIDHGRNGTSMNVPSDNKRNRAVLKTQTIQPKMEKLLKYLHTIYLGRGHFIFREFHVKYP